MRQADLPSLLRWCASTQALGSFDMQVCAVRSSSSRPGPALLLPHGLLYYVRGEGDRRGARVTPSVGCLIEVKGVGKLAIYWGRLCDH